MSNEADELMAKLKAEEAVLQAEEEGLLKEEELLRQLAENPDMLKDLDPSFFDNLQNDEDAINLQKLINESKEVGASSQEVELQSQMQTMMKTHMAQRRKEIVEQKKAYRRRTNVEVCGARTSCRRSEKTHSRTNG